ncbi:hypothetical protein GHK58_22855 [Sinorhizobium meliloti]|uniref:hypothetical protein n=1 Tax=Rhizobium meliloti TaxID=382 RepID=UPI001296D371|nr:hypothetical protein [Sinorhizobium meliloti]MQX42982.1 hypothetical protein [Sinorhizobium meliloti]
MIIYSSSLRRNCEVFGVAISFNELWPPGKRVVFYVKDEGARGLFVEELAGAELKESSLGKNFRIHLFPDGDGLMFLWDYFSDIDHFSRLIDLDVGTVDAFEKARSSDREQRA